MYAQISQPDLDDNLAEFNTGINPGLPLVVYTRKQEKCQIFASDASVPIFDAMMVTTGCKHAIVSGNMTFGWRKLKRHPPTSSRGTTGRPTGQPPLPKCVILTQ